MDNLWKQEYLLDLDSIDEQHKKFFEMTAGIVQLAERIENAHAIEQIIKAIGGLRTYAFLHFKTEEELLLKYAFPGYLHHTTFHNMYLENMIKFEKEFKVLLKKKHDGEDVNVAMVEYLTHMADYVAGWWAEHIVKQDTI
ncbi:bacteriohemerythrin [Maridesulfovibrio frigidus]|uniref:bacteriohemerythrin n=1 Tax=Maridesulfovibrio frigidus TaxID=340956 RepID=UPI0004E19147|nr:hemerythrin domain-containing protein [Maridesulfovibrio frigidus]